MSLSRPSSWSLRARLLAAIIALLAVVGLLIGVATTFAVRDYLIGQVDNQVKEAAYHDRGPGGWRGDLMPPGMPPGTVRAEITGGAVSRADRLVPFASGGDELTGAQEEALVAVPAGHSIGTSELPGLGDFRVAAVEMPDGTILVTAIPLDTVNDTVLRLVGIEAAVVGAGVCLAVAAPGRGHRRAGGGAAAGPG